jgi:hypothetical protein
VDADFWSNPFFWTGLACGGLGGAVFTFVVGYVRRPRMWLGWSVSSTNIVSKSHSKLTIQFDGAGPVESLEQHQFTLSNTGNQKLKSMDLHFGMPEGAKILEYTVAGPKGFTWTPRQVSAHELVIHVDLLQKKEQLTVGIAVGDMRSGEPDLWSRTEDLELKKFTPSALYAITDKLLAETLMGYVARTVLHTFMEVDPPKRLSRKK